MEEEQLSFYDQPCWYLFTAPMRELKVADYLKERQEAGGDFEYFIPEYSIEEERTWSRTIKKEVLSHDREQVFVKKQVVNGKRTRRVVRRPYLVGYVMIHASYKYIRSLDIFGSWIYPIIRPNQETLELNENKYVTVRQAQVNQFRRVIEAFQMAGAKSLSLHTGLVEGDQVRIVSGPFEGFEGTLITSQGKEGGRVVVKLTQGLYYDTLTVPMDNIEVINFSKQSYHIYKKFTAYNERILNCIETLYKTDELTQNQLAQCVAFIRRYSNLQLDTENSKARYYAYMFLTYVVLSDDAQMNEFKRKCLEQVQAVRTDLSQVLLYTYLYIGTRNAEYLRHAEKVTQKWDADKDKKYKDKKYKDIIATIERFKAILS